ncbi:MAG: hypothetical protein SNJ68_08700 [Cyanobacteriota bacterium]
MSIMINLNPEIEALLRKRAAQRGQEIHSVASQLLADILQWEEQDAQEAVQAIQKGLEDFDAGRFRSFQDFTAEQNCK